MKKIGFVGCLLLIVSLILAQTAVFADNIIVAENQVGTVGSLYQYDGFTAWSGFGVFSAGSSAIACVATGDVRPDIPGDEVVVAENIYDSANNRYIGVFYVYDTNLNYLGYNHNSAGDWPITGIAVGDFYPGGGKDIVISESVNGGGWLAMYRNDVDINGVGILVNIAQNGVPGGDPITGVASGNVRTGLGGDEIVVITNTGFGTGPGAVYVYNNSLSWLGYGSLMPTGGSATAVAVGNLLPQDGDEILISSPLSGAPWIGVFADGFTARDHLGNITNYSPSRNIYFQGYEAGTAGNFPVSGIAVGDVRPDLTGDDEVIVSVNQAGVGTGSGPLGMLFVYPYPASIDTATTSWSFLYGNYSVGGWPINAIATIGCPPADIGALCAQIGAIVDGLVRPTGTYENHGDYVSQVAHATEDAIADRCITQEDADAIQSCVVSERAKSDVGKLRKGKNRNL